MLSTLGLTIAVFLIAALAMTVGLFFGRPRLRGSCGGVDGCGACSPEKRAACASKQGAHASGTPVARE